MPSKFKKNKVFHLEDFILMYGIYNLDTLEKLIQYIRCIIKQLGMKNCLWVNSINGSNGIYLKVELYIIVKVQMLI